jgi:pheromone shutdown-related protein TraB
MSTFENEEPGVIPTGVLPGDVHTVRLGDRTLTLVGTAHVSAESVVLVERMITDLVPDVIAIELDERRLAALQDPERWKKTDLYKLIRDGNIYVLFVQLLLQSFQKKISKDLGVKPGAEMMAAYELSQKLSIPALCIDRDIRITLKRAWARASWWSVIKVFVGLLGSLFDPQSVEADEIERLKQEDVLSAALNEFSELLPDVKTSLIDERDAYMAQKLLESSGSHILAVVGAGHVPGMLKQLQRTNSIAELDSIPPKTAFSRYSGWLFPAIICVLIVLGFVYGGKETSTEMVFNWILFTGGGAGIGAALCLAHPISIVTAILAAPLTTLHPMIGVGWCCGLTESYFRKPRVEDLERVSDDLQEWSGWWRNRVGRVLLVVTFSSIGAILGTWFGATSIVRSLI